MIAARAAVMDGGLFEPLRAAVVAEAARVSAPGCVVDAGAGSGHHLAAVLEGSPERLGLALDGSKAAARRAARAHPRSGAIVCDLWRGLPVRDGVAAIVLSLLAPRNGPEFARVLAPGGRLVVATPTTSHLGELVEALGLLTVPGGKQRRLADQLEPRLALEERSLVEHPLTLSRRQAADLVRMGPSARHLDEETAESRLAALPEPLSATFSVELSRFRHA